MQISENYSKIGKGFQTLLTHPSLVVLFQVLFVPNPETQKLKKKKKINK